MEGLATGSPSAATTAIPGWGTHASTWARRLWDCGNYDWVVEVAPDTLLAAYAETDRNDPRRSAILGTWITVKPT